jgi:hypothetical protein
VNRQIGRIPFQALRSAKQRSGCSFRRASALDEVIVVAGAQQREEVEAALGGCGAEPGEVRVADLRQKPLAALQRAPAPSTPGGTDEPGTQHIAGLGWPPKLRGLADAIHLKPTRPRTGCTAMQPNVPGLREPLALKSIISV